MKQILTVLVGAVSLVLTGCGQLSAFDSAKGTDKPPVDDTVDTEEPKEEAPEVIGEDPKEEPKEDLEPIAEEPAQDGAKPDDEGKPEEFVEQTQAGDESVDPTQGEPAKPDEDDDDADQGAPDPNVPEQGEADQNAPDQDVPEQDVPEQGEANQDEPIQGEPDQSEPDQGESDQVAEFSFEVTDEHRSAIDEMLASETSEAVVSSLEARLDAITLSAEQLEAEARDKVTAKVSKLESKLSRIDAEADAREILSSVLASIEGLELKVIEMQRQ